MKLISKWIYKTYKKLQHIPIIVTIIQYVYHRVLPMVGIKEKPYHYISKRELPLEKINQLKKELKQLKIAIICDEMTFAGFEKECKCFFVTPSNWMEVFRKEQPDLFFCESAWHGIDKHYDSWRGKIYKVGNTKFENRKELFCILDFCHKSNIPTVFWNKEDPTYFNNKDYDFVDTALRFDYIYTTAKECVAQYRQLGHTKVDVLMFGFSPKLFNPIGQRPNDKEVVFAGSWYQDQEKRCKDMRELFDTVIRSGLSLKIYDRHWESANPLHQFPEEYRPYVHKGMSFEELSKVLKETRYAININTVVDSETMFARRVFEMMASNIILISNESLGMRKLFGDRIWFIDEKFDIHRAEEIAKKNLKDVFLTHTCKQRLIQVATKIGVLEQPTLPDIFVIYHTNSEETKRHFLKLNYPAKQGLVEQEEKFYSLDCGEIVDRCVIDHTSFVIWITQLDELLDLEFMMTQFDYIEEECGISCEGIPYSFRKDANNEDVLFKGNMLNKLYRNMNKMTKKFIIQS